MLVGRMAGARSEVQRLMCMLQSAGRAAAVAAAAA
eukprot:CAMPEP_0171144084 /NCGR_PEP_ID=MMETSP0766_2-20121228/145337_1 /TAXON_ID=439317 /ORGANISM="Gambierdiscus australes, Strain CAWD 149" /LENGTH=34 /DNA_ID= /DNA_START= /DNA_END= /DNA_ORIENTATION=